MTNKIEDRPWLWKKIEAPESRRRAQHETLGGLLMIISMTCQHFGRGKQIRAYQRERESETHRERLVQRIPQALLQSQEPRKPFTSNLYLFGGLSV